MMTPKNHTDTGGHYSLFLAKYRHLKESLMYHISNIFSTTSLT